jgi:gliding motility-associated protein GldC
MTKTSEIKLIVHLDQTRIPEKIEWKADEAGFEGTKECQAMMLSIWDNQENSTLGIDLWTKEMTVDEMNIYFHQALLKMSNTYRRATKNSEAADLFEKFSTEFAEKVSLDKRN